MTDTPAPGVAPAPVAPDDDDAYALRQKRDAERRACNKAALFAALEAAGITHVVVVFDGYGDSGQIEDVEAKANDNVVKLPIDELVIALGAFGAPELERRSMSVADAVERLAYDVLELTHCGWENNEGAYGDVVFDVAERTITLNYNERIETSEYTQHVF